MNDKQQQVRAQILAKSMLELGEGYDAAVVISALGMAAASAITYGIQDKSKRTQARDFFVGEFAEACRKLDNPQ